MKRKQSKKSQPKEPLDYREIAKRIVPVQDLPVEGKMTIYGKAGSGKTTFAGTMPGPILIIDVSEKGTDSVRDIQGVEVIRVSVFEEIPALYWYLKKSKHKFNSFVWDTVSGIQKLLISELMSTTDVETGKAGWWGTMTKKDWGHVSANLNNEILLWGDLPMHGIFIAHDKIFAGIEDEEDEEGTIDPQVGPNCIPSVLEVLNASVAVIGNTFIRQHSKKIKTKKGTKQKMIIQHCMRLGPHPYYTTKIRSPKSQEVPKFIIDPTFDDVIEIMKGLSDD